MPLYAPSAEVAGPMRISILRSPSATSSFWPINVTVRGVAQSQGVKVSRLGSAWISVSMAETTGTVTVDDGAAPSATVNVALLPSSPVRTFAVATTCKLPRGDAGGVDVGGPGHRC